MRETDVWAQQFNNLHQQARVPLPAVYRKHFFTEGEKRALEAGHPQMALLTDEVTGDLYQAEITWNGQTFTESRF